VANYVRTGGANMTINDRSLVASNVANNKKMESKLVGNRALREVADVNNKSAIGTIGDGQKRKRILLVRRNKTKPTQSLDKENQIQTDKLQNSSCTIDKSTCTTGLKNGIDKSFDCNFYKFANGENNEFTQLFNQANSEIFDSESHTRTCFRKKWSWLISKMDSAGQWRLDKNFCDALKDRCNRSQRGVTFLLQKQRDENIKLINENRKLKRMVEEFEHMKSDIIEKDKLIEKLKKSILDIKYDE